MVKGKKSAILVGCSYHGTQYVRYGCENDMGIIENILLSFGFDPANIKKLKETNTPDSPDQPNQPTQANIKNELGNMINEAGEGDILFFYFSGLVKVNQSNNSPGILSCDLQLVPATEFDPKGKGNKLPKNTSFNLVLEASYSGDFINPVDTDDNAILFSACQAKETAHRVDHDPSKAYGVFTQAIKMVLQDHPPPITNNDLFEQVKIRIEKYQHAGLNCNDGNKKVNFLGYLLPNKKE